MTTATTRAILSAVALCALAPAARSMQQHEDPLTMLNWVWQFRTDQPNGDICYALSYNWAKRQLANKPTSEAIYDTLGRGQERKTKLAKVRSVYERYSKDMSGFSFPVMHHLWWDSFSKQQGFAIDEITSTR